MSLTFAVSNGYSAQIKVVNMTPRPCLNLDAAVFVSNAQLPFMPVNENYYLVGKGVYVQFAKVEEFETFTSELVGDWSFENAANAIPSEGGETKGVKLAAGRSIYFIAEKALYEVMIERVFETEEPTTQRRDTRVDTEELLEYIRISFVKDHLATLPKPLDSNGDIPVENPAMQDAVAQLLSEIDGLKVDIDSNLSIANDASINASAPEMEPSTANNTNVFARLRRPEPILGSSVAAPEVLIAIPRPNLSDSYVLEKAPEKIKLAPTNSIIERGATPSGLKAWKVNHIANPMRVKLTFDKLIPACKLTRVSCDLQGRITLMGVDPIRKDGAYDSVYTTIRNGEYIYFLANELYIDVILTKVEYSDI